MYSVLLYIHSYLRWAVLIFGLYLVVRALRALRQNPDGGDLSKPLRLFVLLLDGQALMGMLMYAAFSPVVHQALQNFSHAMKTPALRFWAVEHPLPMLIALILAHIGKVRASRAEVPRAQAKIVLVFCGIALVLLLLATPWPFTSHARPLLRF